MPIPEIKRNDRIFICGAPGGGKSVLAHLFFRSVPLPQSEQMAKVEPQWRLVVDVADSVVDPALTFYDPANIPWKKSFSLRFVPEINTILPQIQTLFDGIRQHGSCWVWVDELNAVSTSHSTPPNLLWAALQARKFGVGFCSTTPRPRGVNPAFYGASQHLFAFLMTDPNDILHVASSFGVTPIEMRELLYALPPYAYVWYDVIARTRYVMPPLEPELVALLENTGE